MTDFERANAARDEQLLIDFVLGRCDEPAAEAVRGRVAADKGFAALHVDIANALGALGRLPAPEPPADLEHRTLQRVRALRRTEMLLDAQPAGADARRAVFSFRELVALGAAAAIAIAILLPLLNRAQQLSNRSLCQANVGQIGAAMGHYASGNDDCLPATPSPQRWWLPHAGEAHTSNSESLFRLAQQGFALPEWFRCPSTGRDTFVVRSGMSDFPSSKHVSYSYQHSINARLLLSSLHARKAILADDSPIFDGGQFRPSRVHQGAGPNHGGDGQNVLYPDGSAVWAAHSQVGVNGDNIFLAGDVLSYVGGETPAGEDDSFLLPNPGK